MYDDRLMTADMNEVDTLLDELLRGHGVKTAAHETGIALPELDIKARATIGQEIPRPNGTSVQLDVFFELWPGRTLIESCGGFGTTRDDAIRDAMGNFAASALHVLLDAFGSPQGEQVIRETWTVGGKPRRVTLGHCTVRGRPPGSDGVPVEWFDTLQQFIESSDLPDGLHWVRLYYAQQNGEQLAIEVLRDNVVWDRAQSVMSAIEWPRGDGFLSFRLFLVIDEGLDVTRAAARIASMRDADEGAIAERLIEDGASREDAGRAVALVPLAFGRVLLERVGVTLASRAIVQRTSSDEQTELELASDPLYVAALEHAYDVHNLGPRDLFEALALRSAEVAAVNEALHNGSRADELQVAPPVLMLED